MNDYGQIPSDHIHGMSQQLCPCFQCRAAIEAMNRNLSAALPGLPVRWLTLEEMRELYPTDNTSAYLISYGCRTDPSFRCDCGRAYLLPQSVRYDDEQAELSASEARVRGWTVMPWNRVRCPSCSAHSASVKPDKA
jgi:hypothetical protein